MYEDFFFGKWFLKQFVMVLEHLTLVTFDPVIPTSIGFLCCSGQICGPILRKVGQGLLDLLIGNEKGYRPTDRHVQSNMLFFMYY